MLHNNFSQPVQTGWDKPRVNRPEAIAAIAMEMVQDMFMVRPKLLSNLNSMHNN